MTHDIPKISNVMKSTPVIGDTDKSDSDIRKSDVDLIKSSLPALNLDIIFIIMKFLSRSTLSSLMKTCHVYYSIGVSIILRSPVLISNAEHMDSFGRFMFASSPGPPDRFRFLHNVEWRLKDSPEYPIETGERFLEVISRAQDLRSITFDESGHLIRDFPTAITALTGLTRLDEVVIRNTRELLPFLEKVQSPISKLTVISSDWGPSPDRLLPIITHLRDTLVSLEVGSISLDPGDSGVQFPEVRTLRVSSNRQGACFVSSTIFRIFPNLETLDLEGNTSYMTLEDDDILQNHLSSATMAATLGFPQQHLKKLRGEPIDLFRGAYFCAVEELEVVGLWTWNVRWLLPLLFHMRPRVLTLEVDMCDAEENSIPILIAVCRALAMTNSVKDLNLDFDFNDAPGGIIKTITNDLPTVFGELEIEELRIWCYSFDTSMVSRAGEYDEDQFYWESEMDGSKLAESIGHEVPTLRKVTFWRGLSTAWYVRAEPNSSDSDSNSDSDSDSDSDSEWWSESASKCGVFQGHDSSGLLDV